MKIKSNKNHLDSLQYENFYSQSVYTKNVYFDNIINDRQKYIRRKILVDTAKKTM